MKSALTCCIPIIQNIISMSKTIIKFVILTDPGRLHIAINSWQSFDHVARVPLFSLPEKNTEA